MIDLADEESGLVKSMNERPSEQLASEYLECRKTYVLVEVKRNFRLLIQLKRSCFYSKTKFYFHLNIISNEGRLEGASGHLFKSYKPLLNGLDESNPDFIGMY